jgi:UDP-2,3-diacylglucosamine hydrolase
VRFRRAYLRTVLGHRLVIVSDAHLGDSAPAVESALLRFLDQAPALGDALLVNGDLFEFWFTWKHAVPRTAFRVTAALTHLARRMPIVMLGGNHDRWGGDFWRRDAGIQFFPLQTRFHIGRREVLAIHGDGVAMAHRSTGALFHLLKHPVVVAGFGALHPTIGHGLAKLMGQGLGNADTDPMVFEAAAARQRLWAERTLADDPTLGLVVMGHTHLPALVTHGAQQYLNPGAWFDGLRYAIATEDGAELKIWE